MHPHRHPHFCALAALATVCLASFAAHAAPMDVTLGFASLPSAQGWTYTPSGAHAAVLEPSVFAVSGGVLTQNTVGQSNGVSGGSIFYVRTGGITNTESKFFRVTARSLQAEASPTATLGQGGLFFGFTTPAGVQYGFGFTPTRHHVLQPAGTVVVGGTYDNATAFHEYQFSWASSGAFALTRDGVLVSSGSGGFPVAGNRVVFGDGTGGANAHAEIIALRFIQDAATATDGATWGRIKRLYH